MKLPLVLAGVGLTVACWGMYGNVLHIGQAAFNNDRFKPLIGVGLAYMIIAIIVPVGILMSRGEMSGWNAKGLTWSMLAGAAGALGALGIILALSSGGKPIFVMPLVFGGAPVVNTFLAMAISKAYKDDINPLFYVGLLLVASGAVMVLKFAPKAKPHGKDTHPPEKSAVLDPGPIQGDGKV